ncbi:hypothetical protein [Burkholderia cenocepacia]|uniref:hypothetical protein n=1 Tax=Burkholderia cenocepacia TaxID=95486 RepID=UPI002AB7578C|nr:hypothetical protein [Burkholderia cenocepacia]
MFSYPFEGRPSRIQMSGLFNLSPQEYFKLFVASMTSVFREVDQPTLANIIRRIERWQSTPPSEAKARKTLSEFMDVLQNFSRSDGNNTAIDNFLRAVSGDEAAQAWVNELTPYESLLIGTGKLPISWTLRDAYIVELERVGHRANGEIYAGDMYGAVETIESHLVSSPLLWPTATDSLLRIRNFTGVTPQTAAMAMEAHLGWLAAWDISASGCVDDTDSKLGMLLPSHDAPGRNPTSLLFDTLKRRVGAASVEEIADKVPEISSETFYRWSSGKQFPDTKTADAVVFKYGLIERNRTDVFHHQYGAAKLINLIGYICEQLANKTRLAGSPLEYMPWPNYPFGYSDFESWAAARYPYWLAYLRQHGEALLESARASHPVI